MIQPPPPAGQGPGDGMNLLTALSPLALVIGNLVPLVGVVAWDWDVASLVILYWSENLIIGGITILKMLHRSLFGGLFAGMFFIVHYGGFCAVHGFLAAGLLGMEIGDVMDDFELPFMFIFVELLVRVVRGVMSVSPPEWIWGFVTLAASHLVSFVTNYLWRGEYRTQTVSSLMSAPYRRIMVLHLAILV